MSKIAVICAMDKELSYIREHFGAKIIDEKNISLDLTKDEYTQTLHNLNLEKEDKKNELHTKSQAILREFVTKINEIDEETLKILSYFSKKNNFNYELNEKSLSAYSLSRVIPISIYSYYKTEDLEDLVNVVYLTSDNKNIVHLNI